MGCAESSQAAAPQPKPNNYAVGGQQHQQQQQQPQRGVPASALKLPSNPPPSSSNGPPPSGSGGGAGEGRRPSRDATPPRQPEARRPSTENLPPSSAQQQQQQHERRNQTPPLAPRAQDYNADMARQGEEKRGGGTTPPIRMPSPPPPIPSQSPTGAATPGAGSADGARKMSRNPSLEESSFKDVARVKTIDFSELTLIKVIGEGGFKTVWAGTYKQRSVAIGEFKDLDGTQNDEFAHELEMMKELTHDNVVRLLGVVKKPPAGLYMVTEYVKRGSLFSILHKERQRLSSNIRWRILLGIVRGLWYLHSVGLAHRDMKSDNVLISMEWTPKLTDFGMARKRQGDDGSSTTMAQTMCGTALWMPPEIMTGKQYNPKSGDVYSCSMVLYEVIARKIPFSNAKSEAELLMRVAKQKERPAFPTGDDFITPALVALLESMWQEEAGQRPKMGEVLSKLAELCPVKDLVLPEDVSAGEVTPKKEKQTWAENGAMPVRRQLQVESLPKPLPASQQPVRMSAEEAKRIREGRA